MTPTPSNPYLDAYALQARRIEEHVPQKLTGWEVVSYARLCLVPLIDLAGDNRRLVALKIIEMVDDTNR